MEMNALLFATIIFGLFATSAVFISISMSDSNICSTCYPIMGTSVNETAFASITGELYQNTSTLVNSTSSVTQTDTSQQNPLNIALGLLGGAFSAIKLLFSLPGLAMQMIGFMGTSLGQFIPSYVQAYVALAISFLIFIGVAYYFMKVK